MNKIRDVASEEVQAAYCAVGNHQDSSGYDANDPRHPRWRHPVKPLDGSEPMLDALRAIGFSPAPDPYAWLTARHGESALVCLGSGRYGTVWVPRYPDSEGLYGWGTSPQYAIRRDYGRRTLEEVVAAAREHLGLDPSPPP